MLGERPDPFGEHVGDMHGSAVLEGGEDHEPGGALDQRRDLRLAGLAQQQIPFPMARDGAILDLGRPLGDHHHVGDPPAIVHPSVRFAARAPGPQARRQLAAQLPARLHIQRLINRFMTDPHARIIRELAPQPRGDLLRRAAVHQPPLDLPQQPRMRREFRRLRPPRRLLRVTLALQRPIATPPPAPSDLPPHRRAMPPNTRAICASLSPTAIPTRIRSRSSNESRCGDCSTRRRITTTSSRNRYIDRDGTSNSAATSLTAAPARNRAKIADRSVGDNHRYFDTTPPIHSTQKPILLRRSDEITLNPVIASCR